jgi:hypothetical protein
VRSIFKMFGKHSDICVEISISFGYYKNKMIK